MPVLPFSGNRTTATWVRQFSGVVCVLAAFGCSDHGKEQPSTNPAPSGAAAQTSVSGSAAGGSASPSQPPAPRSPHAGAWQGAFKAERAEVTVPEGVTYDSWKEDPGGAEGDGALELTVSDDGSVRGKATGALGELAVVGMIEDGRLSAGLSSDDETGMSGVLSGTVQSGALEGILRVSSRDASVVRKASIQLQKK